LCVNTITATELRTKTKWFIKTLLKGEEIIVIYRSKIIATVIPTKRVRK